MRKTKALAVLIAVCAMSSLMTGCDSITSTVIENTSETETLADISSEEDSTAENSDSQTFETLDELNESSGFTTYDIDSSGYTPVSYNLVDGDIAEIVYNHDGNTATLRVSDQDISNISGIMGTETCESYSISDYDLDIDIQESDNKYIAEWSATDIDGEEKYFSLVEENADIAVFENTLSSYAETALSTASDESDEDGDEDSEGTVVATCDDNFTTYEYEVKEDGSYEFTDPVSGADTYWDIYVLDEQWEDGDRYISQANESQGTTPVTLDLKEGQWVYCICNQNSFTSDSQIDCNLTITELD